MKIIPRSKMARRPIALLACLAAAAPAAAADSPSPERTAQLADLAVVRTQYLPKEMAYSPAARAMAALALDRLERDAGKLSPLQFAIGLAELCASPIRARNPKRAFRCACSGSTTRSSLRARRARPPILPARAWSRSKVDLPRRCMPARKCCSAATTPAASTG